MTENTETIKMTGNKNHKSDKLVQYLQKKKQV